MGKRDDVLSCAPWSRCTDPSEPHAVKLTDFPAMAPSKESSLSSTAEAAATSASNAKTLTDIIMLNSAKKKLEFHSIVYSLAGFPFGSECNLPMHSLRV